MPPNVPAVLGARLPFAAVFLALLVLVTGCKSAKEETAVSPAATGPATVVTQASWAPDELEELVAPIALYPDVLVGQMLAASVNPQEVLDAGNWLLQNQDLAGDALDAAATKAGFGPAMRGLVHFPMAVDMMCRQIDWTRQLGSAFTSDQKGVLDAIQRLRASAQQIGNLSSNAAQTVTTSTENGQSVIEVRPKDPAVVRVPQYDPGVVYTTPPPTNTAQVVPQSSVSDDDDDALIAGLVMFGLGIAVGAAINDDYCYPHYGYGAVYVGPRPFYPPAYAYRPVYPGYRPMPYYRPPAGYRYNYNNFNRNTNININNNNYYGRFNNNANLKGGGSRSPIAGSNRGRGPSVSQPKAGQPSWKGQSTYAGAKRGGTSAANRPSNGAGAGTTARPAAGAADRGYGGSTRTSGGGAAASARPATATRPTAAAPARSAATGASRPAASTARPATEAASRPATADRGSAFSGAGSTGGGSFDRAASARGRASTASSGGSARSSGGGARGGGRGR